MRRTWDRMGFESKIIKLPKEKGKEEHGVF